MIKKKKKKNLLIFKDLITEKEKNPVKGLFQLIHYNLYIPTSD